MNYDAQSFAAAITACDLKDLDVSYIEAYRSVRGSVRDNNSTAPSTSRGALNCSTFRQSQVLQGEYQLSWWTIDPDLLQTIIVADLFDGENDRFETYVAAQIISLELFRKYFFNFEQSQSSKIDELKLFQPIFQIFLKGFLDALRPADHAKHLENCMANNANLRKELIRNKYGQVVPLTGKTDVIMHLSGTNAQNKKPLNSICHIELKAPFTRANLQSSIDQLMAQTDCISDMRNKNTTSVENRTTTLGALTDMFSIDLMFHDRRGGNNREFFVTADSSCDPRSYILRLLALCLSVDALATITTATSGHAVEAAVVENSLSATLSATGETDEGHDDDDGDGDVLVGGHEGGSGTQGCGSEDNDDEDGDDDHHWKAKCGSSSQDDVYEIDFKEQDAQEEWEDTLEFLRQCEMQRMGITLTISNIIAHGGDPTRYY